MAFIRSTLKRAIHRIPPRRYIKVPPRRYIKVPLRRYIKVPRGRAVRSRTMLQGYDNVTLDARLTALVESRVQDAVDAFQMSGLSDASDPRELAGFFKKLVKSIKRTVKFPLKLTKAIVSGKTSKIKAVLKDEVKRIKKALIGIAPIAAILVNVIPGIGQIASGAIMAAGAAGAALKAREDAKKMNAAAEAQQKEAVTAETAANEALTKAQITADTAAYAEAERLQRKADALLAQAAASRRAAASASNLAANAAAASALTQSAINAGYIRPGMTSTQMATALAQYDLARRGYSMTDPASLQIVRDVVVGEATAQKASMFGGKQAGIFIAASAIGLIALMLGQRGGAVRHRRRR